MLRRSQPMKRTRLARSSIRTLGINEPLPDGEPRRYLNAAGYVRLRWRVGPQQYVEDYEHRVNAGRPAPWLDVHHINGIKDDNRPENLLVLAREDHAVLHGEQLRRSRPTGPDRFGGYRSREAQEKAKRRKAREASVRARATQMRRMYEAGATTIQIARAMNLNAGTVSRHLRAVGTLMRPAAVQTKNALRAAQQEVKTRSGLRCERCGKDLKWGGGQVHHRKPRRMGGSADPAINSTANLVHLCEPCHRQVESDRWQAYDDGWLVKTGEDPAAVPMLTHEGWRYLADDGRVLTASEYRRRVVSQEVTR